MRAVLGRVGAVAANTFRETVRERVLYNLVLFAVLMMFAGLMLHGISVGEDEKIVKDIALAAIDVFGTLIAIFIGVRLVSKELERRSLYPLLAKPLSRDEFLLGRFCGLGLTLFVNTAVMTVGLYATLLLTRRQLDVRLLAAVYAIFLGLLLVVAVALLFSTLSSPALAAISTFAVVVVGRFSDVIRAAREVAPQVPELAIKVLYYALPNFHNFDLKNRVVYGDPIQVAELAWLTAYAAIYATLALGAALAALRRRDLP